ncbi:hydroxyphenylacetyl-CoA thioesterase PaaI [Amylibacter sp. IMCC11727]|uniref:hydroxyphenylacetyl-CoA thioesterase PaaI n=1 Tax=Amylibacter sp. IMCC11727 TaxID=3039851 RepID=UPI00244E13CD|nr:hydroxyphenylacetyl-CoA thioesterase PaaI [Amylibacter sp. IMCC11727]WGI21935.1 hydroxyphenylacetyl-CoA thioesterase PaaI [Amylibacter sp. IMCC11727]
MTLSDQDRAERSADAMWANDRASKYLGIELLSVGKGVAQMQMAVESHHCNGHDICHGGFIFTLADSTFAFACNSYNQATVAQHNTITFVAAGQLGDTLTATAKEVSKTGRNGIYDVDVTNQDGVLIASFRGCSRTIKGQNFPE